MLGTHEILPAEAGGLTHFAELAGLSARTIGLQGIITSSCPKGRFRRHSQRPAVEAEPATKEIIGETIEALQVRHHDFLDAGAEARH